MPGRRSDDLPPKPNTSDARPPDGYSPGNDNAGADRQRGPRLGLGGPSAVPKVPRTPEMSGSQLCHRVGQARRADGRWRYWAGPVVWPAVSDARLDAAPASIPGRPCPEADRWVEPSSRPGTP